MKLTLSSVMYQQVVESTRHMSRNTSCYLCAYEGWTLRLKDRKYIEACENKCCATEY